MLNFRDSFSEDIHCAIAASTFATTCISHNLSAISKHLTPLRNNDSTNMFFMMITLANRETVFCWCESRPSLPNMENDNDKSEFKFDFTEKE